MNIGCVLNRLSKAADKTMDTFGFSGSTRTPNPDPNTEHNNRFAKLACTCSCCSNKKGLSSLSFMQPLVLQMRVEVWAYARSRTHALGSFSFLVHLRL